MKFANFPFKVLKKLGLLQYINLTKTIDYNRHSVTIPMINGLGYPNLFLKPNWLYSLINEFMISDKETFIDVGVNVGQTLIAVKSANKDIHYLGFEPNASCSYYLKALVKQNKFENCRIYNFALADRLKENFLETTNEADPRGSIVTNLRPEFFQMRESIFSLDYDSLNLDTHASFIKIDVEGAELEVLKGMKDLIDEHRPYIVCEVLDSHNQDVLVFTQTRANAVCDFLREHHYHIINIIQDDGMNRIVSFREIDSIVIKQWGMESLMTNDYLFVPVSKLNSVKESLTRLSS